jgi:hypothetical protein
MVTENPTSGAARRNPIIAIVAGTVTITAIIVAFAAEYFELPWKWLRPIAELLLLAELVELVVLDAISYSSRCTKQWDRRMPLY